MDRWKDSDLGGIGAGRRDYRGLDGWQLNRDPQMWADNLELAWILSLVCTPWLKSWHHWVTWMNWTPVQSHPGWRQAGRSEVRQSSLNPLYTCMGSTTVSPSMGSSSITVTAISSLMIFPLWTGNPKPPHWRQTLESLEQPGSLPEQISPYKLVTLILLLPA